MACKADVWNIEYLHSALPDPFQKRGAERVDEEREAWKFRTLWSNFQISRYNT